MIAYDIGAIYGSPTAGEKTVLKYWKDFTAGWRRHASLIPPETTQSVTNVCNRRYAYDHQRCDRALARPGRRLCVPARGSIRDLPRVLHARDRNLPGKCPVCMGTTPPNTQGSQ